MHDLFFYVHRDMINENNERGAWISAKTKKMFIPIFPDQSIETVSGEVWIEAEEKDTVGGLYNREPLQDTFFTNTYRNAFCREKHTLKSKT